MTKIEIPSELSHLFQVREPTSNVVFDIIEYFFPPTYFPSPVTLYPKEGEETDEGFVNITPDEDEIEQIKLSAWFSRYQSTR